MTKITLGFTGHRDKIADWFQLKELLEFYDKSYDLTIVHGGAEGFDTQVNNVAKRLNEKYDCHITIDPPIRPDYKNTANKRLAPLKRNEIIVDKCDILVALYDGRNSGGTKYTVGYAEKNDKTVYYLNIKED